MKINFERLKEHLIERGEDEEEEILEMIEKLKGWPYGIFLVMENYLEYMFYEILEDDYRMDAEKLEEYYRKAHPDYPVDEDVTEADNYEDFCYNLDEDEKQECFLKTFYDLGESERDEVYSSATNTVAGNLDISPSILTSFCKNAFPFDPPDWKPGDLDDKSTQEEKEAGYIALIEEYSQTFEYIPSDDKTLKICLAAVQQDGRALEYVPDNLKTAEICLAAITRYGSALEYVPDNLKTADICYAAVQNDEDAMEYVPDNLKAEVKAAIKSGVPPKPAPAAKAPAKTSQKKPADKKASKPKTSSSKPAPKKATAKAAPTKKPAAKAAPVKKPAAKAAPVKKPATKTPTAKKSAAKVTSAKKPPAKKPVAKTSTPKKPVSKATTTKKTTAKLEGLSFCFTGELKSLKRKEAEEKVKALGQNPQWS